VIRKMLAAAAAPALLLTATPAQASVPVLIRSGIAGACAAQSGNRAVSAPCPSGLGHPPLYTELWTRSGNQLAAVATRDCLTAGPLGHRAWVTACRGITRQQWTPAGLKLRNGDGRCLDLPYGYFGQLRLSACGQAENWFLTGRLTGRARDAVRQVGVQPAGNLQPLT